MNRNPDLPHTDDDTLDLQRALSLVTNAETEARKQLSPSGPLLYLIWGITWLLGFGALHGSRFGWLNLEYLAALSFAAAVMSLGIVATIVLATRHSTGIRGHSAFIGSVYGVGWFLGFAVVGILSATISRTVDDFWTRGMLINSIAVLVVGLMYITGGTTFNDVTQVAMGVWFLVVDFVALLSGTDHFLTVFFIFGSGGFLVGAAVEFLRQKHQRNRPGFAHA